MDTRSRTPRRHKRGAQYVAGLAVALGISYGAISLSAGGASRTPIARAAVKPTATPVDQKDHRSCNGGMEYTATVELVPDAVISEAGRESVEYHAEIKVHKGTSVGLAWDAEVIDDRARKVSSKLAPGTARAKASDVATTGAIVARQLPDGFYKLRVRVAVSPDDAPATVMEAVQYVNVNGGKWREMDAAEWRTKSNARLAFPLPAGTVVKGGR